VRTGDAKKGDPASEGRVMHYFPCFRLSLTDLSRVPKEHEMIGGTKMAYQYLITLIEGGRK